MASDEFLMGLLGALQAGNVGLETYTKERRYRDELARQQEQTQYSRGREEREQSFREEQAGRQEQRFRDELKQKADLTREEIARKRQTGGRMFETTDDARHAYLKILEIPKTERTPLDESIYNAAGDFLMQKLKPDAGKAASNFPKASERGVSDTTNWRSRMGQGGGGLFGGIFGGGGKPQPQGKGSAKIITLKDPKSGKTMQVEDSPEIIKKAMARGLIIGR